MIEKTTRQLRFALFLLFLIILVGTLGYIALEKWDFLDAFYMTVITISTTGFEEVKPLTHLGRIFTSFLIIAGVGTIAYTGGRAVQLIIETQVLRRRRMSKKLQELKNHYIVCGYGRMGRRICEELRQAGVPFAVIEKDDNQIEALIEQEYLFVQGDATSDDSLLKAGIAQARGIVAVLPSEAENVFAVLSAKVLNPKIFVVARAVEEETESKLLRAGADRVVNPYEIGGTRMAMMLLRPTVVEFIDIIARKQGVDLNLEEIQVKASSPLIGKTLAESPIRKELNIIIVAIFRKAGSFIYNPVSSTVLEEGDRLLAIGEAANLNKLANYCMGRGVSSVTA